MELANKVNQVGIGKELTQIVIPKRFVAKNGYFQFLVTEIYPAVASRVEPLYVSYSMKVKKENVRFIYQNDGTFRLSVHPDVFVGLTKRQKELNIMEILVYPKFS